MSSRSRSVSAERQQRRRSQSPPPARVAGKKRNHVETESDSDEVNSIILPPTPPPQKKARAIALSEAAASWNPLDDIQLPAPTRPSKKATASKNGGGVVGEDSREKKSSVLNIILNQFFWSVSRKPSKIELDTLFRILHRAHRLHLFDKDIDLKTLQTWFRSKRFHVRRALTNFSYDALQSNRDARPDKLFAALTRCFNLPNLAADHEVDLVSSRNWAQQTHRSLSPSSSSQDSPNSEEDPFSRRSGRRLDENGLPYME